MTCPAFDLQPQTPPFDIPELRVRKPSPVPAVYLMEVTTPDGQPSTPHLPGWTLRSWPVARLGDATLEAAPQGHASPDALRQALQAQGYGVLGPIRARTG